MQRYLPDVAARLPTLALGCWPTAVERLERLGAKLGIELWVKRDDRSAEAYGGNKVRKLELLLAAAGSQRVERLLTTGGLGSNQVLATAIHGRRALGVSTSAVVAPQPLTPEVRRHVAWMQQLGVELLPCGSRVAVPAALLRAARTRPAPFVIGPGGSSPLGTIGYVVAAFELAQQVREGALPCPDAIVVPCGSGGTLAGLWLGLAAAGLETCLVGVRVVERVLCNGWLLRLLAQRCRTLCATHGLRLPACAGSSLELDHGHAGPAYGAPTAEALVACRWAADLEGLTLEPTYTGKALAALRRRADSPSRPRRVLLWNTYNSVPFTLPRGARPTPLPRQIERWLEAPDAVAS